MRYYSHPKGIQAPSVTSVLEEASTETLNRWKLNKVLETIVDWSNDGIAVTLEAIPKLIEQADDMSSVDAEIGTWLHDAAARRFGGSDVLPDVPEELEDSRKVLDNLVTNLDKFLEAIAGYEVIAIENMVHGEMPGPANYGDEEFIGYFSGTPDEVIRYKDQIILLDLKTGKSIYDNYAAQVAAYAYAYNKEHPDQRVQTLWIVKIDKTKSKKGYEIQGIGGKDALLALELFHMALTRWHIRSGRWGDIIGTSMA